MMNFRPGVAIIAIAIAAATLGSTVQAETVISKPVAKVQYSDLNLASAAGRAELDHRIEAATRRMCGPAGTLAEAMEVRRCQAAAFDSVKATVQQLVLDATGATASR